jgi:hypothetical protein
MPAVVWGGIVRQVQGFKRFRQWLRGSVGTRAVSDGVRSDSGPARSSASSRVLGDGGVVLLAHCRAGAGAEQG